MKLYKCAICGNVAEKVFDTTMPLSCCGQEMEELTANTVDAALEKHVPVVEIDGDMMTVRVGEVEHPMTEEHYITAIFVALGNKTMRVDLTPSDKPVATFALGGYKGKAEVFEYCNLHGLWKTEKEV